MCVIFFPWWIFFSNSFYLGVHLVELPGREYPDHCPARLQHHPELLGLEGGVDDEDDVPAVEESFPAQVEPAGLGAVREVIPLVQEVAGPAAGVQIPGNGNNKNKKKKKKKKNSIVSRGTIKKTKKFQRLLKTVKEYVEGGHVALLPRENYLTSFKPGTRYECSNSLLIRWSPCSIEMP